MEPKKSPKADLENKRLSFFLFGIALSLIGAIIVFQYKTPFTKIDDGCELPIEVSTTDMPITVRELPDMPEKKMEPKTEPVEPEPEPTKLKITDITGEEPEDGPDEPLAQIGNEFLNDDLKEIETVAPILLQRIARPFECKDADEGDAQRECLNRWIQRYVNENVDYPDMARKLNLHGKVYVSFLVDENGHVTNVQIVRSVHDILDEEAKAVIEAMPEFIPGSQNGRKVRMPMTVPINFKQL